MLVPAKERAPERNGDFFHQALIYEGPEGFLEAAEPFVREGIEEGEPILVRVRADNAEKLRESLGADSDMADIDSADGFYETPTRTRHKLLDWATANVDHGERARVLGEPPWPLDFEAGVREWERQEAVINVVFQGVPLTFACAYDAGSLPEGIVGSAEATHPLIMRPAKRDRSPAYSRPEFFCEQLNAQTPVRSGAPTVQMPFDVDNLDAVRTLVSDEGAAAGLGGERLMDHTLAVDEVATNAILHGASPARLKLWRMPAEVVWEVSDTGPGIRDPLAGQIAPDPAALRGRGLWMARMICDALEFRTDTDGTVVLHFALPQL